ncbi:MAG: DNA repair protein RadC [Candidatus Omnitrophica bacterium]|nr:DNA repair protein RadC [Candidatus Omnitrophota bacterium]
MKNMRKVKSGIKSWPEDERPREKLLRNGEHTLSNAELLAILIRTGINGQSAVDISRKILSKFKAFRQMSHTDMRSWREFKGLGLAKIAQIKAALEIARRMGEETLDKKTKISSAKEVVSLLLPRMRDLKKEVFKIIFLDSQNRVIDITEQGTGTVNQASFYSREIFQKALEYFAVSIICVHNHPSGNCLPSEQDKLFSQRLFDAGKLLQVAFLDHIIVSEEGYFSFAEHGLIK